jgi:hypothetical protein
MTTAQETHAQTTLESLIDSLGLEQVLTAMATVCYDKAEHIRANWQDNATAGVWDAAGRWVMALSSHHVIKAISE